MDKIDRRKLFGLFAGGSVLGFGGVAAAVAKEERRWRKSQFVFRRETGEIVEKPMPIIDTEAISKAHTKLVQRIILREVGRAYDLYEEKRVWRVGREVPLNCDFYIAKLKSHINVLFLQWDREQILLNANVKYQLRENSIVDILITGTTITGEAIHSSFTSHRTSIKLSEVS